MRLSLKIFKHLDTLQKCAHTRTTIFGVANFTRSIVECVKSASLEDVADFLEKLLNLLFAAHLLEISFGNAELERGRWVQKIYCLWLVSIILVVSD